MSAAREAKKGLTDLRSAMKKIEPFFKPMGEPGPNDWLAHFNEKGQTFDEYLDENPTLPTKERGTIYIQPLGTFTGEQSKILKTAEGYLEAFYDLPVRELPPKKFGSNLKTTNFRMIDYPKHRQVRTGYVLSEILKPALPKDAAALIAFANEDLYPGDANMAFVFGQASFEDRVGVYSLYRLDDFADNATFLRRTLKIAAHELGHMFSMRHCTKYECVMSGTNHLAETDSRPIDACPECMAKVCWLSDVKPAERYKRLAEYCEKNGLKAEAEEFRRKLVAVN
ncbi:MAG TPA: archaemetzincin [Pyrinomonadaceae bacterium]|jgi:archaemetzincin|nr:archaemetzincin [Pyrinomonadaceae bacterium]